MLLLLSPFCSRDGSTTLPLDRWYSQRKAVKPPGVLEGRSRLFGPQWVWVVFLYGYCRANESIMCEFGAVKERSISIEMY